MRSATSAAAPVHATAAENTYKQPTVTTAGLIRPEKASPDGSTLLAASAAKDPLFGVLYGAQCGRSFPTLQLYLTECDLSDTGENAACFFWYPGATGIPSSTNSNGSTSSSAAG
jgi:hypothetical protein